MQKIRILAAALVLCLLLCACAFSAPSTAETTESRTLTAETLVGTSWSGQTEAARCTLTFGRQDVYVRSFTQGGLLPQEYTLSWEFQAGQVRVSLEDMLCCVLTYDADADRLVVGDFGESQIRIPWMQPTDMINTNYLLMLGTWKCFHQEVFGEGQVVADGECTLVISGTENAFAASYTDLLAPDGNFADERVEVYLAKYYEDHYVRVAGEVILGDGFTGSYSFCLLEDGTLRLQMVQMPDGEGDPIYISRWFRRAD